MTRILVVDDSRDVADSMAMILELHGHEVRAVYDGDDVAQTVERFAPSVVLLDIGLGRHDGHDLARELRRRPGGRDLLLIAMTGWSGDADRRKTADAGFDHHLVKPVEAKAVLELLTP